MDSLMIPEDVRKLSRQRAPAFYKIMKTPQPDQLELGQIWSTHSFLELPDGRRFEANEARLVVILEDADSLSESLDQITVGPISHSVNMATDSDLIVSEGNSPFKFDFMVEVWNETPTLKGHLRQCLGKLSDEAVTALSALYTIQLLDEPVPETLKQWVGFRIVNEDDPRLAFQETEIKTVAYLAQAATAALTLEAPVQELVPLPDDSIESRWVFSLRPILANLLEVISSPIVAHAAGATGDVETYIIRQSEGDARFTFELRFRQRRPYTIYVKVHEVSPELVGRKGIVTVNTATSQWRSMPTELQVNGSIQIGEDPDFRLDQVRIVEIEIE
jgi:hypothetical protein